VPRYRRGTSDFVGGCGGIFPRPLLPPQPPPLSLARRFGRARFLKFILYTFKQLGCRQGKIRVNPISLNRGGVICYPEDSTSRMVLGKTEP